MDRKPRVRLLDRGGAVKIGESPAIGQPVIRQIATAASRREPSQEHEANARFCPSSEIEVCVQIPAKPCAALLRHCEESNRHGREIWGLLLGAVSGPARKGQTLEYRVLVTDIYPVESADASGAHVSAHPDDWARAELEIERRYPDRKRLGWYHTHPTQGVFFSTRDLDFHSIFTQPYQVALVVDPRGPEVGLFYWENRAANAISKRVAVPLRPAPEGPGVPDLPVSSRRPVSPARRKGAATNWLQASPLSSLVLLGQCGLLGILVREGSEHRGLPAMVVLFAVALLLRAWNSAALPLPEERPTNGAAPAQTSGHLPALLLALGMLILGVALAGSLPLASPGLTALAGRDRAAVAQGRPALSGGPQRVGPFDQTPTVLTVQILEQGRRIRLSWKMDAKTEEVEYLLLGDGSYRQESGDESRLLRFLQGPCPLQELQEALGNSPNDAWFPARDRPALVERAVSIARIQLGPCGGHRILEFRQVNR
jgi:proteasome lid subunit RPN8/RPN11